MAESKLYYQIVRHVPQEDTGEILDVHTPDIFTDKPKAERTASKWEGHPLFAWLGIKMTVKTLTEDELNEYLRRNIK